MSLLDKFDAFIDKDTDTQLSQYSASRQKEIAGLLKKDVFNVITHKKIVTHRKIVISK